MSSNPAAIYVEAAIWAMRQATSEQDLIDHWMKEKANRERFRLSPHQWPGMDLKQAFDTKRTELKRKDHENF